MLYNEQRIAVGSGVVAEHSSGQYLITAWHNLSGRNPVDGSVLSRTAAIPNRVEIEGCYTKIATNLYHGGNDPGVDSPAFAIHPNGPTVDVTAMRLREVGSIYQSLDVSFLTPSSNTQLPLYVSQTCYIIGFPEGLRHRPVAEVTFPIWKTGHIASEPAVDFDDQPKLLIDATTRRGMSGAMVIVRKSPKSRFVGIYTGRYKQSSEIRSLEELNPNEESNPSFTAELGWVFKSSVINKLIPLAQKCAL